MKVVHFHHLTNAAAQEGDDWPGNDDVQSEHPNPEEGEVQSLWVESP
jgi:hypothetical protein